MVAAAAEAESHEDCDSSLCMYSFHFRMRRFPHNYQEFNQLQ